MITIPPSSTAPVFFLTLELWDRLWRNLSDEERITDPVDHELAKAGFSLVWSSQVGAWARVSRHASTAVEAAMRADDVELAAAKAAFEEGRRG